MQIEQQRKKPDSLYHSAKKYGLPDTAMCVLYLYPGVTGRLMAYLREETGKL